MASTNLENFLTSLYAKSPLQKKKLEKYLANRDSQFFEKAEKFLIGYIGYLKKNGLDQEDAIKAYLQMCDSMMRSQVSFMRSGVYPIGSSDEAYDNVYSNEQAMKSYMIGLAISQFLWSTHYEIYTLFEEYFGRVAGSIKSYLEIGPGHGLYLSKAIELMPNKAKITAVDVSPISIKTTESIVRHFNNRANVIFHREDILSVEEKDKFDFIVMGEVLEHVMRPDELLKKIWRLLEVGGEAFVTTCVDCPAIDHVYHFRSVDDIRTMLKNCGFQIRLERILPVENLPMEEIVSRKITINYCAVIKRMES